MGNQDDEIHTYHEAAKQRLIMMIASLIILCGAVLYVDHLQRPRPMTVSSLMQAGPGSPNIQLASTNTTAIKSGLCSAAANYIVPHDVESINVSLTLSNDIVTAINIVNKQGNPDSARYQQDFAAVYKNYVVGRSIKGLQLDTVSGASGTTRAFNVALRRIMIEAQA